MQEKVVAMQAICRLCYLIPSDHLANYISTFHRNHYTDMFKIQRAY